MAEWIDEIEIDVDEVIVETDDAILAMLEDGREEWFPKSHISDNSEVYKKGHSGGMIISPWIAKQKGLA